MMIIKHICKHRKSLLLSKQNGKQGGNYITDQVTPIHLCETVELVNKKKLASENLLYAENCADNATPTFSFNWILHLYTRLIIQDKDKYICFACV
jgi:hypothetical protein